MSSNINWRSEDDEILIDFVRNHEAIYNVKCKEYRKTQLKHNWWCEIGEILNKTDSDCSKRWCYIRDYYIRRRAKPGTGASGETAKKRADLLSFLDSYPTSSQRVSSSNVVDENSGDYVTMESAHDNTDVRQTPVDRTIKVENTNNSEETQSSTLKIEYNMCDNNDHEDNNGDRKRKQTHSQERLNTIDSATTQNELDENDLFFGSMAKIVKKLSPYEQVQLRLQIGLLVGNAQLRRISSCE